jgi:outer membrane receptor protein involved in Fe transport
MKRSLECLRAPDSSSSTSRRAASASSPRWLRRRGNAPKTPAGDELQEVIVTANRREENLQNVPITIQVLTGETLAKLNATTFDDFVKYLPGVTAHGVGPGQNNIYVRGLGTADSGIQGSGSRHFPERRGVPR